MADVGITFQVGKGELTMNFTPDADMYLRKDSQVTFTAPFDRDTAIQLARDLLEHVEQATT